MLQYCCKFFCDILTPSQTSTQNLRFLLSIGKKLTIENPYHQLRIAMQKRVVVSDIIRGAALLGPPTQDGRVWEWGYSDQEEEKEQQQDA